MMNNKLTITASTLLLSTAVLAAPPVTEPVDANIVNTVDANVVNTVDTNIVNTISAAGLGGVSLSPTFANSITAFFPEAVSIRAISTSIVPATPGDRCNLSVGVSSEFPATEYQPLGLSVLSNGQAATVSRNYEIPLEGVKIVDWDISGPNSGCAVSLSISYTEIATPSDAGPSGAQLLGSEAPVRVEVR